MTPTSVVLIIALCLTISLAAKSVSPIWLSPTSVVEVTDAPEQFPDRGVWSNISTGAGGRFRTPLLLMDSKKILWISFGTGKSGSIYRSTVWNYDPKTDLYRWVAGPGDSSYPRNPGQLRVSSPDNAPGPVYYTSATIDYNDNIWFLSTLYGGELWMFNTTSYEFTRMYGPNEVEPVRTMETACFVTDSQNNLWLLSGIEFGSSKFINKVWHFNTSSMIWKLVSGNDSALATQYGDDPYYSGRQSPGCDIDADDRVWLFGGLAGRGDVFSDMWSFDTRTTQWQLERGSNATVNNAAVVVSDDFHPDNLPSARESASMIDRKDGTLIVACGAQGNILKNDIWLYNKSSKLWKQIYEDTPSNFSNYRAPGSVMPARLLQGTARGLNVNGDLFIYGGGSFLNDIWLIPHDQCTNNATNMCGSNAHCVEEMLGHSCACDEGFIGDGQSCTAIPLPPVVPPSPEPLQAAPLSSNEPIGTPTTIRAPVDISVPQSTNVVSSGCHVVVSWLVFINILMY